MQPYWWWCCSHTQHIRSDRYTDSSSHVRENFSLHLYQTFTVGTERIQTPLHFSLFVSLQPFAKIKKVHFISH